jgi:hypothetical protein
MVFGVFTSGWKGRILYELSLLTPFSLFASSVSQYPAVLDSVEIHHLYCPVTIPEIS